MLNIIVAASTNNAIGYHGAMPWHCADDLRYFKRVTMGHTVIMGRKTYQSIGRPLPGRHNVVVTRDATFAIPDAVLQSMREGTSVQVCCSVDEALAATAGQEEVFVIGGGELYRAFWPLADRFYLTRVHTEVADFDASVPPVPDGFVVQPDGSHEADADNDFAFTHEIWTRP